VLRVFREAMKQKPIMNCRMRGAARLVCCCRVHPYGMNAAHPTAMSGKTH
jgi:hypothetical protein